MLRPSEAAYVAFDMPDIREQESLKVIYSKRVLLELSGQVICDIAGVVGWDGVCSEEMP